MVNIGFICLIPSSSWLKGKAKTPAGKAQATRRLIACPWKPKSCTEINCGVASGSAHVSHLFVFRLGSFRHVSTSFFYGRRDGKNSIIQKYVMLNEW